MNNLALKYAVKEMGVKKREIESAYLERCNGVEVYYMVYVNLKTGERGQRQLTPEDLFHFIGTYL
jgi:hypothetical protein